ncbi:MAG TPA: glycosyltransferase family 39 protein [Vicinamibacterales bacterium]|nr:glycosyltransferase family 39 protein [Vicinamibacterales bacterium]
MEFGPTTRRALRLGAVAAAVAALAACVAVMVTRLTYPYEAEWIEGALVDGAARILSGQPLYAEPSVDFVAAIYAPLYFYTSAAVAWLTGVGFFPLRLVSFVCTAIVFVLIYRLGRRDADDAAAGLVAVGLLAAMYRSTGAWFEIGRVDALALALAVGGATLARAGRSTLSIAIGAGLLGLSIHTKQSMIFVAAGVTLYAVWQHTRRDAAIFLGALAGVAGLLTALFMVVYGDWYRYYVYELGLFHEPYPPMRLGFWLGDLGRRIPVFTLLAAAYLLRRGEPRERKRFYLCLLAGAIGCSWSTRMKVGAWFNVLIPTYMVIGLIAALELARLWRTPASDRRSPIWAAAAGVALVVQLVMIGYRPWNQMPSSAGRAAIDQYVRALAAIDGDVWVLSHGYIGLAAGKPSHAHWQAVADVLRSEDGPIRRAFDLKISTALREQRFKAIVIDGWEPMLDHLGLRTYYTTVDWPAGLGPWPKPITGAPNRPKFLLVPR